MSFAKAAEEYGCSLRHFVRIYAEQSDGKYFRIGHNNFIARPDFERWMASRANTT